MANDWFIPCWDTTAICFAILLDTKKAFSSNAILILTHTHTRILQHSPALTMHRRSCVNARLVCFVYCDLFFLPLNARVTSVVHLLSLSPTCQGPRLTLRKSTRVCAYPRMSVSWSFAVCGFLLVACIISLHFKWHNRFWPVNMVA